MKRVTYKETTIVRMSPSGLSYLDDDGKECFIDFAECRLTFRTQMGPDQANLLNYVGFRNSGVSPSYVELLTEPPTRFEFANPTPTSAPPGAKFVPRTVPRGYLEFRDLLADAGVATGDLD